MTALKLYGVRTEFNVTLPPKQPQITNLPTPAQVIQLVRGTDIELPCMLALWLSLRVSEVRGLQFGDLKDGVLTVQRSKLALANRDVVREVNKTYLSTRQLVLPPYLIGLIQAIPHTSEDEFIVPMSYQAIRAHLTKLARAKGYTLTFHQLRHLNASVIPAAYVISSNCRKCFSASLKANAPIPILNCPSEKRTDCLKSRSALRHTSACKKNITWDDIFGKKAQSLPRLIRKRITV